MTVQHDDHFPTYGVPLTRSHTSERATKTGSGVTRVVPQRGDAVAVRWADGGALDSTVAVCWFVEPMAVGEPVHIRVCNVGNLGLAGWKRRLHWADDGTPWGHEYAEDPQQPESVRRSTC